jgi:hypothetical protein
VRLKWAAAWLGLAAAITLIILFDRAMLHFLGWDGQTSDNYAAWSGSIPALETGLGMSTLITGLWAHINCRDQGCMRLGHFPDARGVKWCWKHHPEHRGERPTTELLHRLHFEHRDRQAAKEQ